MNWSLTLISFACLPFIAFFAVRFGTMMLPLWTTIQQRMASLNTNLQENLSGVRVVKAFSRQKLESQKFDEQTTLLYEPQLRAARIQAFRGPLFNALTALASALVLFYGGRLVLQGHLNVGQLTEFYLYLGFLIPPIRMIGPQINMTSRAIASGKRIFEVLDTESAVKEKPDAVVLSNIKGDIKFIQCQFHYESAKSQ
jgi:ATP-binding cassette subfamily B multidrug efflux pump